MLEDDIVQVHISQDAPRSLLDSVCVKQDSDVSRMNNLHHTIFEIEMEEPVKNNKKGDHIEEYFEIQDIGERSD
jgi:hypothetical protein